MSLPNPQRQAFLKIFTQSRPWPIGKIPTNDEPSFKSAAGATLYFLGVSQGGPADKRPSLNIAVFGYEPPVRKKSARPLAMCQFGGVTHGPDKKGWFWVEGLEIARVRRNKVTLRGNNRTDQYRPTW
ncbi:MAG: hypothetical protein Q7K35_04970 [bacterium]|nr:hypothetical protein [bacterium]